MCYTSLFLGGFAIHHHFLRALEFHDELNWFFVILYVYTRGKRNHKWNKSFKRNQDLVALLSNRFLVFWRLRNREKVRIFVGPPVGGQDFFGCKSWKHRFLLKWWLTSRDLSLKTTWRKKRTHTHKHTKFETKALNKKHVLIREDPDPFDEDICLKTFGFG